ncbi:MAG: hypothetical protein PVI77_06090 [Desulfobacterales bacterium]|jgi:hypothetical protein
MRENVLVRSGSKFTEMPRETWKQHIAQAPKDCSQILSFMTEEHHLIRYFVVRALPHIGKPIPPELISDELKMPLSMTNNILDDLERNLFFWVRNEQGEVLILWSKSKN